MRIATICVLVTALLRAVNAAFVVPKFTGLDEKKDQQTCSFFAAGRKPKTSFLCSSAAADDESESEVLDIVLFGIGDLRVDDHLGLKTALEAAADDGNNKNKILPLFVLTDNVIANIPGGTAHTVDTVTMLTAALQDLDASLKELHPKLALHTAVSGTSLSSVVDIRKGAGDRLRVHVCDLGTVDNALGYGAFSQLQDINDDHSIEIVPWNNHLRDQPWTQVAELPDSYPKYEAQYTDGVTPKEPVTVASKSIDADKIVTVEKLKSLPSVESLLERFIQVLDLDPAHCQAETNTGLYATHWGGLPAKSIGCRAVLQNLQCYATDCQEDSEVWSRHPSFAMLHRQRNSRSLEHAAMTWQLTGDSISSTTTVRSENWLAGEAMTRYLAAPLLLGTVSPRRIWRLAKPDNRYVLFSSPLRKLVEGQEWHRLLAARNVERDACYRREGKTIYKYWRYQGFLCRYAETDFANNEGAAADEKEGILLVHGFGASGTQWNKAMQELSKLQTNAFQGLAPDMLGFGQSEKPAISYTSYLWESYMMDFVKEIAIQKNKWTSYVTGGNSIGGFASMSLAASDTAVVNGNQVSSSGAPGTGRCTGLVLMNSAGPIKTKEEIETERTRAEGHELQTVAQMTALDALPVCKPPPRPIGRAFGNVLLGYLRPRIQSICRNLYPTNPDAVDIALCDDILRDSLDPGAINVMISGAKLPPPRTANELLAADFGCFGGEGELQEGQFRGPVLISQGVLDPLNDANDRMNRYGALREGIQTDTIPAGHCPHDELPDQVAKSIASWLSTRSTMTGNVASKMKVKTGSL